MAYNHCIRHFLDRHDISTSRSLEAWRILSQSQTDDLLLVGWAQSWRYKRSLLIVNNGTQNSPFYGIPICWIAVNNCFASSSFPLGESNFDRSSVTKSAQSTVPLSVSLLLKIGCTYGHVLFQLLDRSEAFLGRLLVQVNFEPSLGFLDGNIAQFQNNSWGMAILPKDSWKTFTLGERLPTCMRTI